MSLTSTATQTEFNFELILNFVTSDLPRLISYDVVPVLFKVISDMKPENNNIDHHKLLQQQIESVVRNIVNSSLPNLRNVRNYEVLHLNKPDTAQRTRHPPMKNVKEKNLNTADCPVCGEDFGTFPTLIVHLPSHKEQTDTLNCKFCNFSTIDTSVLAKHFQNAHVCANPQSRYRDYKCNKCEEVYYSQAALSKHGRKHRDDIPKCPKCNVLFEFPSQLATHLKFSKTCGTVTYDMTSGSQQGGTAPLPQHYPPTIAPPQPPPPQPSAIRLGPAATFQKKTVDQKKAATMIGSALLSALDLNPASSAVESSASTVESAVVTTTATPVQYHRLTEGQPATVISEDLIMDVSTGKPIPVSQYLSKHRENNTPIAPVPPTAPTGSMAWHPRGRGNYKCDQCNRVFNTVGVLSYHMQKVHLLKKTLSCTQCHLLFIHYNDLESHFHRCHKMKRKSKTVENGRTEFKKIKTESENDETEKAAVIETDVIIEEEPVTCEEGDINLNSAAKENFPTRSGSNIKTESENDETEKATIIETDVIIEEEPVICEESDVDLNPAKENFRTRSGRNTKAPLSYNQ